MSDLFNIYEDKLNTSLDRIKKIIETFTNLSREKAESAIQDANSSIKESDKILKQMEIECSAVPNKTGNPLPMKLKFSLNEFESIKKTFYKIQDNYIMKKSEELLILGAEDHTVGDTGGLQRSNLIQNEERLAWNQGEKVEQIKRSAVEIEVLSVDVMRHLDRHTDQLKHIHVKVNNINGNIEESNSLLNGMSRRITRNKLVMLTFAVILILAIILFILYRIISSNTK